jgi:hypothetical protein
MKLKRRLVVALLNNRVLSAALFVLALGLTTVQANAQQGRFVLPFEAHWNKVVLPAGEYKMSTPMSMSWPQVITVSGQEKTYYILTGNEAIEPPSGESYLRILNVDGMHVVQQYKSLSGKSFTFAVPKEIRADMARGGSRGTQIAVMVRR